LTTPDQTAALVMDTIPMFMRILRAKFREKYAGDLSMVQFRTLAYVDAREGVCLSEAARHIGLGLPTMSKLVETLVKRDLIARDEHGQDRRKICLTLTAQGKHELGEAYRYTQSFFADKFAELTDEERNQIREALKDMQTLFGLNTQASRPEPPDVFGNPDFPTIY
jgi:DNA-binding MarR family transcriptional regulator